MHVESSLLTSLEGDEDARSQERKQVCTDRLVRRDTPVLLVVKEGTFTHRMTYIHIVYVQYLKTFTQLLGMEV